MQPIPARRPKRQPVGFYMSQSTTEIGSYIRERRLALNMSQKTLAKLVNVVQTEISAIETGRVKRLDAKYIQPFARALQCDIDELRRHNPVPERCEPKSELGKFVRSRREKLGLSLTTLSERMGVSLEKITQLDNGMLKTIPDGLIAPLANALEVNRLDLVQFILGTQTECETQYELGQFIRTRRKALGMGQRMLAQKLGITNQWLSQIELGKHKLTQNSWLIQRIIDAVGISPKEIEAITPRSRQKRIRKLPAHKPPGFYRVRRSPLGKFITNRRLRLGLTQAELKKQAGIGACLSRIEQGKDLPSRKTLEKILTALKCDLPSNLTPYTKYTWE